MKEDSNNKKFIITLNPILKSALKARADQRGLNLSAYIQEVLWRHCPEAEIKLMSQIDN